MRSRDQNRFRGGTLRVTVRTLLLLVPFPLLWGCQHYVPVNLPVDQLATARSPAGARTVGDAQPATVPVSGGDKFRVTMNDGTRFLASSLVMSRDSLIALVGPGPSSEAEPAAGSVVVTSGTYGGRISVPLYEVRLVEEEELDLLSTASLLILPVTLTLLITN